MGSAVDHCFDDGAGIQLDSYTPSWKKKKKSSLFLLTFLETKQLQ